MPTDKQIIAARKQLGFSPADDVRIRAALTAAEQAEPAPAARSGAVKSLTEDDYEEIINAAAVKMRKAASGVRGQVITVQDSLDWWVMKETERRILAALEPAESMVECCSCGAMVDTREVSEGGDYHGSQLEGDQWVCSPECWDAKAEPAPAPAAEPVGFLDPEDIEGLRNGESTIIYARDRERIGVPLYTHPTPSEARLREALGQIDALDPEGHTAGFSVDALRGLIERMGAIARAALKEASDERS